MLMRELSWQSQQQNSLPHATLEVSQHELQLVIFTSLNIRVSIFLGGMAATVIFLKELNGVLRFMAPSSGVGAASIHLLCS